MRALALALLVTTVVSAPVLAQTTPAARQRVVHPRARVAHPRAGVAATNSQRPIDVGPNTPAANSAYQGGGVILQGQPGGPAPVPEATPPGQTPRNSVQP